MIQLVKQCLAIKAIGLLVLGMMVQPVKAQTRYSDPVAPVGNKAVTVPAVVKPILNHFMRDTYITLGPDGNYYMTGTVNAPKGKKGIYLWKSPDMKQWQSMGCVWNKEKDGTWQKSWRPDPNYNYESKLPDSAYQGVWAPELHYIKSKKTWLLIACISHGGSFILKSTSGKPEGPYVNIEGNAKAPIFNHIDGGLFQDDNGAVYVLGHNHFIARMKDDLSGLAEPFKHFAETPYNPEPYLEGVYMIKHNGKYQLIQTAWSVKKPDGSYTFIRPKANENEGLIGYDVVVAESDNIYGPYGPRYAAIMEGGHNNIFTGKDGKLWSTTFFNPRGLRGKQFAVTCRPAVLAVKFENGKLMPDAERTEEFYSGK